MLRYLAILSSVICRKTSRTCLGRRLLEVYVYKFSSLQSSHKTSLEQQENPSKIIQMIMLLIINNLGRLVLFRIICRTQIWRLCLKARSQQASNKSMLESAQQTKKIDLNYYVINHQ